MEIAQTAAEAFDRYHAAYEAEALIQSEWHKTNGKDLACALGVLGGDVRSARDCPVQVMPRWLAQMVPWFFDNQPLEEAKVWGLAFYAELKRINGKVPFSVVHDWQANFVGPLAAETAAKQSRDVAVHEALALRQAKALAGEKFTADEWHPVLKAAFLDIYKWRYRADANAYADAYAYANANAYADAAAAAAAYANANADAAADADANADAAADADAAAAAYANANANAYADADADAYAYRARIKALADGMVECLKRVPA